ncbi:hypothetical protein [Streptomyces yangpuensis]|uniref:hypothetical protein n=1 Tax=Streptomyces yangpuensis TaxID=1648182 RepID=UPI000629B4FA|nr:hypothetical protein [Streptomyces yangpuensis]
MSTVDRNSSIAAQNTVPAVSIRRRRSTGALAWCQFVFSVGCAVGGVALSIAGLPAVGIPLIVAAPSSHITITFNR